MTDAADAPPVDRRDDAPPHGARRHAHAVAAALARWFRDVAGGGTLGSLPPGFSIAPCGPAADPEEGAPATIGTLTHGRRGGTLSVSVSGLDVSLATSPAPGGAGCPFVVAARCQASGHVSILPDGPDLVGREVATLAAAFATSYLSLLAGDDRSAEARPTPVAAGDHAPLAPHPEPAAPRPEVVRLYDVAAVREVLDVDGGPPVEGADGHRRQLAALVERGTLGADRSLLGVDAGHLAALDDLALSAPHLAAACAVARSHALSAINLGTPLSMPPLLVHGPKGSGKTWFATRLAHALGLPHRVVVLHAASSADAFRGIDPARPNAHAGVVARTLLAEDVANPAILVENLDAPGPAVAGGDAHAAFSTLHEPEAAAAFVDDYLQFPIDASNVVWVMTATSLDGIPQEVLDRVVRVPVGPLEGDAARLVARNVYGECNARHARWFSSRPPAEVEARLVGLTPRAMRLALEGAMASAGAEGRRTLRAADLPAPQPPARMRPGFIQPVG